MSHARRMVKYFILVIFLSLGLPRTLLAQSNSVQLRSGFRPDIYAIRVAGGGTIDLTQVNLPTEDTCVGYVNQNSNFTLQWGGSNNELNIFFIADNGVDPVIMIRYPDEEFRCKDDTGENLNPKLKVRSAQRGQYDVWVGSLSAGQIVTGVLYISEQNIGPNDFATQPLSVLRPDGGNYQFTDGHIAFASEFFCQSGYADACNILQSLVQSMESAFQNCGRGNFQQCLWLDQVFYDYQLVRYSMYPQQGYTFGGGSTGSSCPVNDAQTCALLNQANGAMLGAQQTIDDLARRGITATSGGLIERCINGDVQACNQFQSNADAAIGAMDSMYGPGWSR